MSDSEGGGKVDLRREMRRLRAQIDPASVPTLSRSACARLRELGALQRAHRVGAFLPMPCEIDLEALLSEWAAAGKEICVPAFHEAAEVYRMSRYRPGDPVIRGRHGIREPARPEWAPAAELDAILAPGLAFDRHGNRLGHGGGVYDRLLADFDGWRFGIAFSFQLIENIPADAHDCPMHAIVTPDEALWCAHPPSGISYP